MFYDPATKIVMPEGAASAFTCLNCNASLPKDAERRLCESFAESYLCACGEVSGVEEVDVWVLPSSESMLEKANAHKTVWFHSTNVEYWDEKIVGPAAVSSVVPYIHVGTVEAAMERFRDKGSRYGWLYEIELTDDCVLADEVYEDRDDWVTSAERGFYEENEDDDEDLRHALRYVNRWESPGSISLLLDPRKMKIVGKTKIGFHPMTKEESKAVLKEFAMA